MNLEEIELRIKQISNEMTQTTALYAKLEGHLGEAQHWLSQLTCKDKPKEETNGQTDGENESKTS